MFLDLPEYGKTEWWRYFLGFSVVLFFWFVLGSVIPVLLVVYATIDGNPDTFVDLTTGFVTGIDPMINFVSLNLSFMMMISGLLLTMRLLHKRPFQTLITPFKQINRLRAMQGFIVYGLLVALASVVEYLTNPDIYILTLDWQRFIPFSILILIFTPIQTSAEELFFRGYLLQASGHFSRSFIMLAVFNGFLFMVPHLVNPEVNSGPLLLAMYYFGIGAFLAFITLRDNGLELAMGAHAANNMYAAIFANYTNSVLPTDSIFTVQELNPLFGLLSFVVIAIVFYLILLRTPRPKMPQLELQEQPVHE